MQSILHATIIALPVAFAVFMILDLIANLNHLWKSCEPSIPVSIPASIPQSQPEPEELGIMPDPWELEASAQPAVTTTTLTLVPRNLLLLPPAKSRLEVLEVVEPLAATAKRKAGRPKKEVAATPTVVPAKRGRPRKTA